MEFSEVPMEDDPRTMYSYVSVCHEVSTTVEVWVKRNQVERDIPFLLHQHTHMQLLVHITRALLHVRGR